MIVTYINTEVKIIQYTRILNNDTNLFNIFVFLFNTHALFLTFTLSSSHCSGKNVTKYLFVQNHLFWSII